MAEKKDDRRSFRLSDDDMFKLAEIAVEYFGTSEKQQTAALKLLINQGYKEVLKKRKSEVK